MLRWWLDRGVDGFRMDVVNMISKDPALPDGWVPPGETLGHGFPHFLSAWNSFALLGSWSLWSA